MEKPQDPEAAETVQTTNDQEVAPAAICSTVHLSGYGNPRPSEHFISRVASRLEAEKTIPRDSNIVERIRMMTAAEIVELATTGEISMWSNATEQAER